MRTKVSPSVVLRRWPICAALLGLMLVCSTMIFPPDASDAALFPASRPAPVSRAVEADVDYPPPATSSPAMPSMGPISETSS